MSYPGAVFSKIPEFIYRAAAGRGYDPGHLFHAVVTIKLSVMEGDAKKAWTYEAAD